MFCLRCLFIGNKFALYIAMIRRSICFFIVILSLTDISLSLAAQQLDSSWQVTAGGQTVQVNPDGSFRINNISSPDNFGNRGPGTPRDFLGDDFVRLTGFSRSSGVARYVYSERFRIEQDETFLVENLIFSDTPPPIPVRLRMNASRRNLNFVGDLSQANVTAVLGDNSLLDVSDASSQTTYRTSSLNVADVNADGLITATGEGTAIITAINEGISTAVRVRVDPDATVTTLVGILRNLDGSPLVGATVSIVGQEGSAVSGSDGFFRLENVVVGQGDLVLLITNGTTVSTSVSVSSFVIGGFTDVGLLEIESGDPGTSVQGFVQNEDGTPAANATVTLLERNLSTTTNGDGFYRVDGVPTVNGAISVRITLGGSVATVANVDPIPNGVTNMGTAILGQRTQGFLPFGNQVQLSDDQQTSIGALPFDFDFFGEPVVGDMILSSNGVVTLNGTAVGSNFNNYQLPTGFNSVVAPFFDDLDPGVGGLVGLFDDAENGVRAITWELVPYFGRAGNATFQVAFYNDGSIEFRYADITSPPGGTADSGVSAGTATIGLGHLGLSAVPSFGNIFDEPTIGITNAFGILDEAGLIQLKDAEGITILMFEPDGDGGYLILRDAIDSVLTQ